MSDNKDVSAQQPIIVVRRKRGGDDGHHGGAWKIAFADFMTAMMAFFLVMWLVNAADKKTIIQVAAYFNPMRLTDRSAATDGLEDPMESDHGKEKKKKKTWADKMREDDKEDKKKKEKSQAQKAAEAEAQLLSDPGKALDAIAAGSALARTPIRHAGKDAVLHDPFDPQGRDKGDGSSVKATKKAKEELTGPKSDEKGSDSKQADKRTDQKSDPKDPKGKPQKAETAAETPGEPDISELADKIKRAVATAEAEAPGVEVKATPEGVIISLIDSEENGMFEIGSAKPKPETLAILEQIGEILQSQPGRIVVRGHTDGRAYKGQYDNWRLSSARAQMAFYMLNRGGLEQDRFLGVEGRADKDLKIKDDKDAAQNRRIDILIKGASP